MTRASTLRPAEPAPHRYFADNSGGRHIDDTGSAPPGFQPGRVRQGPAVDPGSRQRKQQHVLGRVRTSLMARDTIFQMTGSTIRFGDGATREVGTDFVDFGCRRVLAIIDPAVRSQYPGEAALESLRSAGVDFDVFTDVRCEPTDGSFRDAIAAASSGGFQGFLAVGGGSTIDTAKAANLYATWPAEFLEYVNPTLGRGGTPPGPLKPLIAVPTTAGTGSETTAVAVFDFERERVKTGIANRYMRPTLGVLDPDEHAQLPEGGCCQRGPRRAESCARIVHGPALSAA